MKNPNSIEELMRSWTPRAPSSRLEEKLFGTGNAQHAGRPHSIHLHWRQTLGASAVAFAVAIMTLLNMVQLTGGATANGAHLSLSNHSSAASFALASAPINTLRAPLLGWTNEGSDGLNLRSFDLLNTNRILR